MKKIKYYESKRIHDLREILSESAELFAMRPAFYQKINGVYKSFSYLRFKSDVDALGTALMAKGFGNSRILVLGENSYQWCLAYMTVVCGLGVVVPADKELPAEEVANIAKLSEASLILYSSRYAEKISCVDASVTKLSFDEMLHLIPQGKELMLQGDRRYFEVSIDIDAMSALIFTSGTTGVSKGVMLSQRNLCTNIENLAKMVYVDENDIALSVLPSHHVYECTCGFLFPLSRGAAVAFSEGVRYIMRNMKEIRPTKMLCVPLLVETVYRKIWANIRKKGMESKVQNIIRVTNAIQPESARMAAKRRVFREIHQSLGGRIDLLVSGGAPVDPDVLRGLRDFGFPIIQGYGLTESAPLAAVNHDSYYRDYSAGLVLPGGTLKIVDPGEDGAGEICYRGDNVMLGYYNRPDLTAEVKKNGWLHTGDIGYLDENGFLVITGRKKNVIVTANGKNIFPEELETYLGKSPFVAESVVVGIMNEKKNDYDIVASVYPNMEYVTEALGKHASSADIEAEIAKAVAEINHTVQTYKRITVLLIRNTEFPKNTSKKIKRFEVKEEIAKEYREKTK